VPTLVTMSKDGTLTVANVDPADLHLGPLIVRGLARVENPTRIEATIQSNSKPVESTETRRNHGMNSLRSISKERQAQEPEWSGKMTFKI